MTLDFLPAPGRHQSIDGSLQSGEKESFDQPKRASQRYDDRERLRQLRDAARFRQPNHRRHDDSDKRELAELDADIEADQRPRHRIARQTQVSERAGEAQPMDQAERVAAISQRQRAPLG
jgi:hypothetical protein